MLVRPGDIVVAEELGYPRDGLHAGARRKVRDQRLCRPSPIRDLAGNVRKVIRSVATSRTGWPWPASSDRERPSDSARPPVTMAQSCVSIFLSRFTCSYT